MHPLMALPLARRPELQVLTPRLLVQMLSLAQLLALQREQVLRQLRQELLALVRAWVRAATQQPLRQPLA